MSIHWKPDGYHTITPYLVVEDVDQLISFLQSAFAAEITEKLTNPDGATRHAEVRVGDSMLMIGPARDTQPAMPAMIYLYMEDTDAAYHQAIAAGATSLMEPADQFYGDRNAGVQDSQGNLWWIATHVEDVDHEEMQRRMHAMSQ